MRLFFSNLFLEARDEILKKIVGFSVETMTSKSPFEINWPLMIIGRFSFRIFQMGWNFADGIGIPQEFLDNSQWEFRL